MGRERSWWGWGWADQQLGGGALDGLATLLTEQFHVAVGPATTPDLGRQAVAASRLAPPDALADLVDLDPVARLRRSHGNSFRDVVAALEGRLPAITDAVVRPRDADDVERVLGWCVDAGVACVPFGGGTSVVGGVTPPSGLTVALDLERLDTVEAVDADSRTARIGAGATGPRIDEALRPHGLTLRHYPQSWEFATMGGWVVTRAGGHYATGPTHIDDLTAAISAVTPTGRYASRPLPGSGAGPSPDRLWLGSEGALGVVTDATVRVQARPLFRAQASLDFSSFAAAAGALRSLAQSGLYPANARVLDPVEAQLAGADPTGDRSVLVLGFESADHALGPWLDRALELGRDHGGEICGGPSLVEGDRTGTSDGVAGEWRRAFLSAPYLRDALVRLGMVVETFETALPWSGFDQAVERLRTTATALATEVCGHAVVGVRITHAYPDGAAPYLTVIAPGRRGDRIVLWDRIKEAVSDAILELGGTITHHHAVGRDHVPWYVQQRPAITGRALRAVKDELDPAGILNPGVLGLGSPR